MKKYVIAASLRAMQRNEGTEIMASSLTEALDKYEVMGGECVPRGDGTGATWTRLPDGTEQETFIECLHPIEYMDDPEFSGGHELVWEGAAS